MEGREHAEDLIPARRKNQVLPSTQTCVLIVNMHHASEGGMEGGRDGGMEGGRDGGREGGEGYYVQLFLTLGRSQTNDALARAKTNATSIAPCPPTMNRQTPCPRA